MLRKAALLTWKSLCRFACSHRFKHAKTFCFMNAEELLLVSLRSFGLEHLDQEIPSTPDMYLICPSSVVDTKGTVYKPLVLFCQRNWPEEWNSQTSSDEDILRSSSQKYNFEKAKEWYKYPIKDENLVDTWSNKLNAAKRRKCCPDDNIGEDDDVIVQGETDNSLNLSIMPSPISSSSNLEDE